MTEQPEKESIWQKRYLKIFTLITIISTLLGILAGYIYYIKIGCNSGSCPITSNPWMSMLWGAMMGYLVGDLFNKEKKAKG